MLKRVIGFVHGSVRDFKVLKALYLRETKNKEKQFCDSKRKTE